MKQKTVSVLPCFNNGTCIYWLVKEVKRFVDEVVVVDDGSKDETASLAEKAGAKVIKIELNKGKANAVRVGIDYALKKLNASLIITHLDCDYEHEPSDIKRLKQAYEPKNLVIGKRKYNGKLDVRSFVYRWLQDLLKEKLNLFVADPLCGFRLFNKHFAELLLLYSKAEGFGLELEEILLADRLDYKIKEVQLSTFFKQKWHDLDGSRIRNEIQDNVKVILQYQKELNLSKAEVEDIQYGFFGLIKELSPYTLNSALT